MVTLEDCTRQSPYSDPGRHAALLAALPGDLPSLCAASRNVIAHYRAELVDLPPQRHFEVDSRWLEIVLEVDQRRHGAPLVQPRAVGERVAGCCRDHALFVVGALRQREVPARSRVGFAHCFTPGFAHDHVVVEYWAQGRWRRADPELVPAGGAVGGPGTPGVSGAVGGPAAAAVAAFDPHDIPTGVPTGAAAPFETAAQAWLGWRAGERDASRYGVVPSSPWCGAAFVRDEVLYEVAHRCGDELLLWDGWGALEEPGVLQDGEVDELARLLVLADGGDAAAEADLVSWYRGDERLHPGESVITRSPFGGPARVVELVGGSRAVSWGGAVRR